MEPANCTRETGNITRNLSDVLDDVAVAAPARKATQPSRARPRGAGRRASG